MMKIISHKYMVLSFFMFLVLTGCLNQDNQNIPAKETNLTEYSQEEVQQVMKDIRSSYIDNNVPSEDNFLKFLRRDLKEYFKNEYGNDIIVEFELLRDEPTQSGVAYPKYYAWITIYSDNKEIEQGAVRLAAIDKEYFDITNFISLNQIRKDTNQIYNVFPAQLCDKIKEKL